VIGELPGLGEASLVLPLAEGYAFNPYRNYRMLSRRARAAVLAAEVEAALRDADGMVCVHAAGGEPAAAVARRLPWDSSFFGVPMARVDYLLGADPAARLAALRACLARLRGEGARHVSARVDVADVEAAGMLEDCGFRLKDALVTYAARPGQDVSDRVRTFGSVRPLRDEDGPELVAIARAAFRSFRGRFHADASLPRDRVDAFYEEWARQCLSLHMAQTVLVSEASDGSLLGFLAFRRREPVSTVSGVPVFGGGLGACRPDAAGAYAGLIRAGTLWAHQRGGVAECQTQNHNFPTIRIYEAVGARYVRAEYTFHLSLDADPA
jgi:hypothetical protein